MNWMEFLWRLSIEAMLDDSISGYILDEDQFDFYMTMEDLIESGQTAVVRR